MSAALAQCGAAARAWNSGFVPVTGRRLAYHRTGGTGPAVVLSHGLTDNGLCWIGLAAALAGEFDVVMLDARGHGDSTRMPDGEAPDPGLDLAEAIEALGDLADRDGAFGGRPCECIVRRRQPRSRRESRS